MILLLALLVFVSVTAIGWTVFVINSEPHYEDEDES